MQTRGWGLEAGGRAGGRKLTQHLVLANLNLTRRHRLHFGEDLGGGTEDPGGGTMASGLLWGRCEVGSCTRGC